MLTTQQTPALAAANGGPLETILDGKTGWLRSPTVVREWTAVMHHVLTQCSAEDLQEMARAGREHVEQEFSERKMAERLDGEIEKMVKAPRRKAFGAGSVSGVVVGIWVSVGVAAWGAMRVW